MKLQHADIKPETAIATLSRDFSADALARTFDIEFVGALVGMSPTFIKRVLGARSKQVALGDVLTLLDQDSFHETFVPRSRIPNYLLSQSSDDSAAPPIVLAGEHTLLQSYARR